MAIFSGKDKKGTWHKAGSRGKKYYGPQGKSKADAQAAAVYASGWTKKFFEEELEIVTKPFVSQAQRAFMYAKHPKIAAEFESKTPKGEKLPEHKRKSIGQALVDMYRERDGGACC